MEHFLITEISKHGYLAIFLLMTLESACIPIPSEAIMLFGGALASGVAIAGVGLHLNVALVAIAGALGNLLGSWIAYAVGRTGGRAIVERWGKYILIRHHDLDRAEAYFAHRGQAAVLVGRVLPVVRTFISFPAGIAEMPIFKFSLLTLVGSLPWTFALAYAGKALASNWQSVSKAATPVSAVFALIIAGGITAFTALHHNNNSPTNSTQTTSSNNSQKTSQVVPVDHNPIQNTATQAGLAISNAMVENNVDPTTGQAISDRLQFTIKNNSTQTMQNLEAYYTMKDAKTNQSESYYQKLSGLSIAPGKTQTVYFDNGTGPGHYPENRYSIYRTSQSAVNFTIEVSAPGFQPAYAHAQKGPGTGESPTG